MNLAQSFINPAGEIVLHRRKITPTHVERSLWGDGQADSLKSVVDTPFGKVGGLSCWERIHPLLRYYEYSQSVEIHVTGWSPLWKQPKDVPIYGPDGAPLVEPLAPDQEGILYADIDLSTIDFAKQMIDVVGRYSRPDLLSLQMNTELAKHVTTKQHT
ncbi:hypothetical protein HO133_005215 [Letharia lupina]|uniref:nitrilase n=1 Tax=Letharia lupina TaxID=560253 RepID=A0A8H6C9L1_9LECA|nr:uncharacterized protein HO133_005215 [Letharia lupina]KAF6219389.1 hypothetical protein HO133_005215 [Letharia lupina]